MLHLALSTLILTADGGVTMTSLELTQQLKAFAKDGGGEVYAVAVTTEPNRPGYTFSHWAGFFTTAALRGEVSRPSPPYLLVCNHPHHTESKNQSVVEELVRWEPDGTLISTGIIYSKWGAKGRTSGDFKAAAMKLLKRP